MAGKGAPAGVLTTYTIFGDASGGHIQSRGTDYAAVRGVGANLAVGGSAAGRVGQDLGSSPEPSTKFCWELGLAFNTSTVLGTVQSAVLSLYGSGDFSTTDFVIEARIRDWGTLLDTPDWVAGDSLGALPLAASHDTAVSFTTTGYNALTSEAAMAANINKTGFTRFLLHSNRHRLATTPTGPEWVHVGMAADADPAKRPKLVIQSLV